MIPQFEVKLHISNVLLEVEISDRNQPALVYIPDRLAELVLCKQTAPRLNLLRSALTAGNLGPPQLITPDRTVCSLSLCAMSPWSCSRVMSRAGSGWGPLLFAFVCISVCLYVLSVCVAGSSGESPFLCGAGGSFWGWAAGGPADMLSRSSSTTRPYHCSAPHSLCPVQSASPPAPTPPPSPPVSCPAGAADPWPGEGGSAGPGTIAELSSYLYINSFFYLYV